jgi:hypothetical protein
MEAWTTTATLDITFSGVFERGIFPWKYVGIPDHVFVFSETFEVKRKFLPETAKILNLDYHIVGLERQVTKQSLHQWQRLQKQRYCQRRQ